jgi:TP901 family phage tail tape measure protein
VSNIAQYTLSLQDKISAKLRSIGINSDSARDKFSKLEKQTSDCSKLMNDMGRSVGSLREKLALLKAERDWIPEKNLTDLRKYNTEIKNLEKQILRLETINGSKLKKWSKEAITSMPHSDFFTNPVVAAGTALGFATKASANFRQGMAKINTTAQLSNDELNVLGSQLQKMAMKSGTDLATIPAAFESIISKVGDTNTSLQIFESSLKGAKAGFTDVNTVADALSTTLSIVGKEKATAGGILDTFFAAKRVGAGEFKDFAAYMPSLINGGKALGIEYQQVAGAYAYMTTKASNAAEAQVYLNNVFSAFGKGDIRKNLAKEGIELYNDKGQVNKLEDVMAVVNKKMAAMTDEQKNDWLQKMGIVDKEARAGFIALSGDAKKLQESLAATANPANELQRALDFSSNPMQNLEKAWVKIQFLALKLGDVLMAVLAPALLLVDGLLTAIVWVVQQVEAGINSFTAALQNGNPWVWGLVTVVTVLSTVMAALWLWQQRTVAMQKLQAAWAASVAAAKWLWAAATGALNTALVVSTLLISGIVLAIVALIAIIGYAVYAFDGWGAAWQHTMDMFNHGINAFVSSFKLQWLGIKNTFLLGVEAMQKAWYKFQGLWDKKGAADGLAALSLQAQTRAAEIKAESKYLKNELAAAARSGSEIFGKNGLHANGKTLANMVSDTQNALGIAPPKVPGTTSDGASGEDKDNTKSLTPKPDAIATGGTKTTHITINIRELGNNITIAKNGFKESAKEMSDTILDELVRAVTMAQMAAQ